MSKVNVLVFPSVGVNAIEIHDALCACFNINVWGTSTKALNDEYIFENYEPEMPLICSPDFFDRFNEFLIKREIDFIFATHDTAAAFLADNADKIHSKLILADKETCSICRDKEKTYAHFKDTGFVPKIYSKIESFPVFIKPREGQGGVGAALVRSGKDLPDVDLNDYVISEYLPGEEYTVDCLTGADGKLLFASPRSRARLMAGISVAGKNEELTPEIQDIADTINSRMSFLGMWWFQIKKHSQGNWKLLEVSVRGAGTMCLTRARGVNLPLLSVYIAMGRDISFNLNPYNVKMDRTLISRYKFDYEYDTVYFDFDDTLTIRGKVNLKAVWFLYQCQNLGKKVVLLTKHEDEILDTMKRYRIDKDLFVKIVHIKPDDNKAAYINPHRAIFVDNAFQERNAVYNTHGIPVFDADAIDVLMDWKC